MIVTADARTQWNVVLASATQTMLPTVAAVVLVPRWFVHGLPEMEK